ncbi:cytochrome B5 isoform D, ARABIDOPSIS CYTOCHROME B5 ISOFORM D [Hibiscus trionum]|uniref:Cytochrome B5 isoform D, ARABIDOPSIS CYTOCHROME B5 ISOFORM D n=1 Tax=Hibiscus trionum TaxID=183268 RepID=A0A9W7I982_HIBTR|nr:cytochrome B5 isoform D, ARABIDOPSIS CYTOCHROME B5 ISOFORM D [Hibiscus trionum]
MGEYTVFTLSQVAHHKSKKDCWLVIHGRVLNVTKFLEEHPGGEEVLMEWAGKDATQAFQDIGHSMSAQKLLLKYQVGVLQGCTFTKGSHVSIEEPKKFEMSAFVIKDDRMPKYELLLDFFLPLLVAGSYLAYRCMMH